MRRLCKRGRHRERKMNMAVFRGKDGVCAKKKEKTTSWVGSIGSAMAGGPRDGVQTQPGEN